MPGLGASFWSVDAVNADPRLKQEKDDEKADSDLDGGCSIDDVRNRFASREPNKWDMGDQGFGRCQE